MKFQIAGLQKISLLDYPDKIAAIIFTQGCNFRCKYCHNPELLPQKSFERENLSIESVFSFLNKRRNLIEAVVVTGGEPCLQKDLEAFLYRIKKMNFLIKLDTNGSKPQILQKLISKKLLDYIAMDIKGPFDKYQLIINTSIDIKLIKESISLIMKSNIDYEFRTTILKSELSKRDCIKISNSIFKAKKYFLQKFQKSKNLDPSLNLLEEEYSDDELLEFVEDMKENLDQIAIR